MLPTATCLLPPSRELKKAIQSLSAKDEDERGGGSFNIVSYTASKHGLAGITKILANEWAARGINVNAIAPGYFATDNTRPLRDDPVRSREILGRIPAGRWGEPDDLGGAAVFLASPASDYVHGAILPVDGGWLNR